MWLAAMQGDIFTAAKNAVRASGLFVEGDSRQVAMVAEMVTYGDSGAYLDKVPVGGGVTCDF